MNLAKKMQSMGQKLANKPSKKELRKQRCKVKNLRRSLRSQIEEQKFLIEEEVEQDRLMREYLSSGDMEQIG